MEPKEIKQALARRTGRVIADLNSLGDVLGEYTDDITQEEYEQVLAEVTDKLHDLMDMEGRKPVPYSAETKQWREEYGELTPYEHPDHKRENRERARKPRRPRIPRPRSSKALADGTGLPFQDI